MTALSSFIKAVSGQLARCKSDLVLGNDLTRTHLTVAIQVIEVLSEALITIQNEQGDSDAEYALVKVEQLLSAKDGVE